MVPSSTVAFRILLWPGRPASDHLEMRAHAGLSVDGRALRHESGIEREHVRTPPPACLHQALHLQLLVSAAYGVQVDGKVLCQPAHRGQAVTWLELAIGDQPGDLRARGTCWPPEQRTEHRLMQFVGQAR
jgi:hypothetical protein